MANSTYSRVKSGQSNLDRPAVSNRDWVVPGDSASQSAGYAPIALATPDFMLRLHRIPGHDFAIALFARKARMSQQFSIFLTTLRSQIGIFLLNKIIASEQVLIHRAMVFLISIRRISQQLRTELAKR